MISVASLVELICNIMEVSFEEVVYFSEDRVGKDQSYELDSQKSRHEISRSDQITLENGIEVTLAWARNYLQVLEMQPNEYVHRK